MAALLLGGGAAAQEPASGLTAVEARTVEPAGEFGGVSYVRVRGSVRGVVAPGEDVVGLAALPKNAAGRYEYASAFEIIAPAPGQPANEVVYVDAENRGSAISQGALGGFLQENATSYARVQWQTGISPGVPPTAQGVGLVIMRDFARWLAGRTPQAQMTGPYRASTYQKLMLGGISQSAWLVNTFIAEGFNVDPQTGGRVFDAALAVDGTGNWLAINRIAADRGLAAQTPYVDPNGVPLAREALLKRPATDPFYVDIANFTDFYRLRAGLTSSAYSSERYRRYDFPSPHAVGTSTARCNDSQPITYLAIRYAPYMRAIVRGMQQAIGVRGTQNVIPLPPSMVFTLGPPPANVPWFNPLPGVQLRTPVLDRDGWPLGGVRFPEAEAPLGRPHPPAVPPVATTSIAQTCGNFAGFEPLPPAELARRPYADSADAYVRAYDQALERLVRQGLLLPDEVPAMLTAARTAFGGR